MASKKEILKNITNYTPEEIADAVRSGVVSMYELGKNTEGAFTPLLRKRVKELLEQTPMPTVENDKENVSEIENSVISDSSTTEDLSIPDELEITPITEELPSLIKEDPQTPQDNTENKPGMFRNPFSFSGRIRRTEYGLSMIICFVINLFMQGIVGVAAESDAASALLILYLIMLVPYFGLYGHKVQNVAMIEVILVGSRLFRFMAYGCFSQKEKPAQMNMEIVPNNHF